MDRPNILLIITDQQSATMLSCAGNPHLRTPALDSLAARGMRFERAYCTNPVCVASRTSLLSGRMPGEFHGNYNEAHWTAPAGWSADQTLGALLRRAGYRTFYGGKIHVPPMLDPARTGYDYFCADERDTLSRACAELIRRPHPQPFFLVASFINPHDICYHAISCFPNPRTERLINNSPVEMETMREALQLPDGLSEEEFFKKVCPPLPENHHIQNEEPEAVAAFLAKRGFQVELRRHWSDREWRLHRWAYCRLTERVDAEIGRLLTALDQSGLRDNTLVIFTSDHGDNDGSHQLEHKSLLYEEAIRIPLIVSYPGRIPEGSVDNNHLVSNGLDLLPTLCDYAAASLPPEPAGLSLRPLLENHPVKWRKNLYLESEAGFGIVGQRFKYVLYNDGKGRNDEQLYDRQNDPGETGNHASIPENRAPLERGRELLAEYQKAFYGSRRSPADLT